MARLRFAVDGYREGSRRENRLAVECTPAIRVGAMSEALTQTCAPRAWGAARGSLWRNGSRC